MTKDKELEECKKLNMLLERWMEVDESEHGMLPNGNAGASYRRNL